ncbi:unnamed protein product [Didymodactylos carnosus]|uniref:Uncharacterized protein n=1 Tax=Didymodactylos carnosus TaxID=1234261 RepID=A0A815XSJ1_9BILA|nr:unnamed protein product [Didymodactylos carnosus]CAF1561232.1 unnamed protein product [Didymodactylos carnosus]CAF4243986.1 unnamed protein product [Didymodactylos carnosus]CAF4422722.1 unnamed protein product [Didymodactylos carnosus]
MLDMLHKENNLEKRIDRMDLRNPSKWKDTDGDEVDFPQLSEDDIREPALVETFIIRKYLYGPCSSLKDEKLKP